MRFIELAEAALERGAAPEQIAALETYRRLQRIGEEAGEQKLEQIESLRRQMENQLQTLAGAPVDAGQPVH
jgi:hypothetical protein